MINLRAMASFLNFCDINDTEACFGVSAEADYPEYISVKAALLDAVSSTDDSLAASVAIAFVQNMSAIDTSSITEYDMQTILSALITNAKENPSALNCVALYMYTGSEGLLETFMALASIPFHDAALYLLALDSIPCGLKDSYVRSVIYNLESSLVHKRYDISQLPDSIAVLRHYGEYVQSSRVLKGLIKLYDNVPSANSTLRYVFTMSELMYLSYHICINNELANTREKSVRIATKFIRTCIQDEQTLPDCIVNSLYDAATEIFSVDSIKSSCANFANFKRFLPIPFVRDALQFPVYDPAYFLWSKYMLHSNCAWSVLNMMYTSMETTPVTSVRSLIDNIPGFWLYANSASVYVTKFIKQLVTLKIYSYAELLPYMTDRVLLAIFSSEPKLSTDLVEAVFDSVCRAEIKLCAAMTYISGTKIPSSRDVLYERCVTAVVDSIGSVSWDSESDKYVLEALQHINIYVCKYMLDDIDAKKSEKRRYGKSAMKIFEDGQVPRTVIKAAHTEKELMNIDLERTISTRDSLIASIGELTSIDDLGYWLSCNSQTDVVHDVILKKIFEIIHSTDCSAQDMILFVGESYNDLLSAHINPDLLLNVLRTGREGVC